MAIAEGELVPSDVGYRKGCPLPSRLGDLGERLGLPQRGPGQSPGRKRIWHILKATELSFLYLRGQFALASPTPNYGDVSPLRDLRPCF